MFAKVMENLWAFGPWGSAPNPAGELTLLFQTPLLVGSGSSCSDRRPVVDISHSVFHSRLKAFSQSHSLHSHLSIA